MVRRATSILCVRSWCVECSTRGAFCSNLLLIAWACLSKPALFTEGALEWPLAQRPLFLARLGRWPPWASHRSFATRPLDKRFRFFAEHQSPTNNGTLRERGQEVLEISSTSNPLQTYSDPVLVVQTRARERRISFRSMLKPTS